ncbi:MAG: hypothetical protein WB992_24690 [Bryobacteraceae bacterium]
MRFRFAVPAMMLLCGLSLSHAQEHATSSKAVTGGVSVTVVSPYRAAYRSVLQFLKKKDYTIDNANEEIGQITTAVTGTEGWKGTRSWVQVSLFQQDETHTSLKIAVANQNRSHTVLAGRGEYHAPKVNMDESQNLADEMKEALTSSSSTGS